MASITITGHRPNKLYGYDLMAGKYCALRSLLKRKFLEFGCTDLYTGMALGVDQLAALAAIDLQDAGCGMRIHAAIPCRGHSSKWPKRSRDLYEAILSRCATETLVTDAPYAPALMQRRNIWMADRADVIIAVWDGTSGGTGNCVSYALSAGKPVWRHDPSGNVPDGWIGGRTWQPERK